MSDALLAFEVTDENYWEFRNVTVLKRTLRCVCVVAGIDQKDTKSVSHGPEDTGEKFSQGF